MGTPVGRVIVGHRKAGGVGVARMEQCPSCGGDLPGGVRCPTCTSDPLGRRQNTSGVVPPGGQQSIGGAKRRGKRRLLVVGGIGLAVVAFAVAVYRFEDDHTKAVKSCISEAVADGTDEPAAQEFCEAVVTKNEEEATKAEEAAQTEEPRPSRTRGQRCHMVSCRTSSDSTFRPLKTLCKRLAIATLNQWMTPAEVAVR